MVRYSAAAVAAAAATLWTVPASAAGIYDKSSPVLQLNAKSYEGLIAKSNYTSIVEFYAPWCGHCQRLAPQYAKAAENLQGIAKVAAIDCDEETNKPFCAGMGVQGFPTLKIVRPSKDPKRAGKPSVEDYRGERTGKAIVDAVVASMTNHVRRMGDADIAGWLKEANDTTKAIVFSEKGTTASMTKALAIDFLGSVSFAQVRNKEEKTVGMFGVDKFPALVVLPGGNAEPARYDGPTQKQGMLEFLSKFATPNPDAAGKPGQASAAKKESSSKKSSSDSSSSSSPSAASESTATPSEPPPPPTLPILETAEALESTCLTPRSSTCLLLLLDSYASAKSSDAAAPPSLKGLATLTARRGRSLPGIHAVPASNEGGQRLLGALGLAADAQEKLVAVNGKKGWWARFAPAAGDGAAVFDAVAAERWIDDIRMGDFKKERLPAGVVVEEVVMGEAGEKVTEESTEEMKVEEPAGSEEEPVKVPLDEEVVPHDEL